MRRPLFGGRFCEAAVAPREALLVRAMSEGMFVRRRGVPMKMERVRTTQIGIHAGTRVRLAGWLHRVRTLSNVSFLILRDGYGTAQIVVEEPELAARIAALTPETVLQIEALVVQVLASFGAATVGVVGLDDSQLNALAFAVLVPMFGIGMNGAWAARYGSFGPRVNPAAKQTQR